MTRRGAARQRIAALTLTACTLGSCVTETIGPARPRAGRGEVRVAMPEGPVARPAPGTTGSAAVSVAVQTLGVVQYDGQLLPVISPDGRFLATQQGLPPSWDVVLSRETATTPLGSSPGAFVLGERGTRPVEWQDFPPGCVLGRDANDVGVLVEQIRSDNSRRIGVADWVTGAVSWVAEQDGFQCAGAVFDAAGAVVWIERSLDQEGGLTLVRRAPGHARAERLLHPSVEAAWPITCGEPGVIGLITFDGDRVLLRAHAVFEGGPDSDPTIGGELWSALLARSDDRAVAYQSAMGWSRTIAPELVVFHPGARRMVAFEARSGRSIALPADSDAACVLPGVSPPGALVSTPDGLLFASLYSRSAGSVRVWRDPGVPRAVASTPGTVILIAPGHGRTTLELTRLRILEP